MRRRTHRFPIATLLALALAFGAAAATAADSAAKDAKDAKVAKPAFTTEQAAAMETMQRELARLDPMLEKVDDAKHKAWVKEKVDGLKARFQELQKNAFDQAKFDELRFDVNIEYQRLGIWLRAPLVPAKPKK